MKTYNEFKSDHPRVNRMKSIVTQYGPYRLFPTLTFHRAVSDEEAIDMLSIVVRRLNKKILGKYWKAKGCQPLRGIVSLERTSLKRPSKSGMRIRSRPSCHFHLLIKDHEAFPDDNECLLVQFDAALRKVANRLNYMRKKSIVGKDGIRTQIVDTEGVHGYIVKEARHPGWVPSERLFLMDKDGLLPMFDEQTESGLGALKINSGWGFFAGSSQHSRLKKSPINVHYD